MERILSFQPTLHSGVSFVTTKLAPEADKRQRQGEQCVCQSPPLNPQEEAICKAEECMPVGAERDRKRERECACACVCACACRCAHVCLRWPFTPLDPSEYGSLQG